MFNSCHPTITFTAEYSLDKVNFLEVEVILCGNKFLTDLYIKPTYGYSSILRSFVLYSKKSILFS